MRLACLIHTNRKAVVSTVVCPAGGATAEVMSREAEGQQGLEQPPAVEKFGSVGRNSLDVFSPAREGQCPAESNSWSFCITPRGVANILTPLGV